MICGEVTKLKKIKSPCVDVRIVATKENVVICEKKPSITCKIQTDPVKLKSFPNIINSDVSGFDFLIVLSIRIFEIVWKNKTVFTKHVKDNGRINVTIFEILLSTKQTCSP
jgi:hypothetical protein